LSDAFTNQNGLKQGDALLPWILNSLMNTLSLEVQENQEGMKTNGTHQCLVCAAINLVGKYRNAIKKNTESNRCQ
jgi:hypothetical protein